MNAVETIIGLRILLGNALVQVESLLKLMTPEQAATTRKACELAGLAINEANPTLRQLAKNPRAK